MLTECRAAICSFRYTKCYCRETWTWFVDIVWDSWSLTEPLQSPFVSWGWVQCRPCSTGGHQSRSKDPQWSHWGFTAAASEGTGAVKAAPKNFDVFFFFFLHLICRKMKSKPYTIISLIQNCKLYIMFWSSLWIIQSVCGHSQTPEWWPSGALVYCFSQKLNSIHIIILSLY